MKYVVESDWLKSCSPVNVSTNQSSLSRHHVLITSRGGEKVARVSCDNVPTLENLLLVLRIQKNYVKYENAIC